MAPFHLLGQEDQKEMQCDNFGHVVSFAWASYGVNGFINGTTAFILSR